MAAIDKLIDQRIIAYVAISDKEYDVINKAINKLTDQRIITDLAINAKKYFVRKLAIRKVTDQKVLYTIALNDKYLFCRGEAIVKLTDQKSISKVLKMPINKALKTFTQIIPGLQSSWDLMFKQISNLKINSLEEAENFLRIEGNLYSIKNYDILGNWDPAHYQYKDNLYITNSVDEAIYQSFQIVSNHEDFEHFANNGRTKPKFISGTGRHEIVMGVGHKWVIPYWWSFHSLKDINYEWLYTVYDFYYMIIRIGQNKYLTCPYYKIKGQSYD